MFSQKLKELRKQHNLTQAQLAKELNIGTSTIGMYESNIRKPSYNVLLKIANFFNVPVDLLMSESTPNNDSNILEEFANGIKKLSPEELSIVKSILESLINRPK